MIYGNRSNGLLKLAKISEKCSEFSLSSMKPISFDGDPSDLHMMSIYVISQYVKMRRQGGDFRSLLDDLLRTAQFYDSVSNDENFSRYHAGYWHLAMVSYFLVGDYGSAIAAANKCEHSEFYGEVANLVQTLICYLLIDDREAPKEFSSLARYLKGQNVQLQGIWEQVDRVCRDDGPENMFYSGVLRIIVEDAIKYSARKYLPKYSNIDLSEWYSYISAVGSPRILWHAQRAIASNGVLSGKDAVIQLPTGSGKTSTISLIVRTRFLSLRAGIVVVVAPLRALCREIASDLKSSLADFAEVYLLSDSSANSEISMRGPDERSVYVATPEKLLFAMRRDPSLVNRVRLFVFDEIHLLDDATRGPNFELLLSELLQRCSLGQMVLISAVLPNAGHVARWAFGHRRFVVSDPAIVTTSKAIGFLSTHDLSISFASQSDFMRDIFKLDFSSVQTPLKRHNGEKQRMFPDMDDKNNVAKDLMLSFSNRLIHNGACALFIAQRRSIRPLFVRLAWLLKHEAKLSNLTGSIDPNERDALVTLAIAHYGDFDPIVQGFRAGVLPHYGALIGSVRKAVEQALTHGHAHCVACTSTLAEGVNLPIKYLLISSARQSNQFLSARVFQNLIGRTARPGKHSEGTVLLIGKNRARRSYSKLVDPANSEPCYGSLIDLVYDRDVFWEGQAQTFDGRDVLQFMISHLSSATLDNDLIAYISRKYPGDISISKELAAIKLTCLEAVQGYIAGALMTPGETVDASELCRNTYAYAVLDDEFRESLIMLFDAVLAFLQSAQSAELTLCSREQRDIRYSSNLWDWVTSPVGLDFVASGCKDHNVLFELFLEFHLEVAKDWELKGFLRLVEGWLTGQDLSHMCRHVHECATPSSKQLDKIEKSVDGVLRYKLPRFVGSVREAFTLLAYNGYSVEQLGLLERMLRFGVGSISEVVFCETVLDDRWIASEVVHIIGAFEVADASELHRLARSRIQEIMRFAGRLPSYCRECLVSWLDV